MSDTHQASVLRPVDRLQGLVLVYTKTDSLSSVAYCGEKVVPMAVGMSFDL